MNLPPPVPTTHADPVDVTLPTAPFRRSAWLAFERALDPLAVPRPYPGR
jgi:hypothetical protein